MDGIGKWKSFDKQQLVDNNAKQWADYKSFIMYFFYSFFVRAENIDGPKQQSGNKHAHVIQTESSCEMVVDQVFHRGKIDRKKDIGTQQCQVWQ